MAALAIAVTALQACGDRKAKEEQADPPKVVNPPERGATVQMVKVQIPDGKGSYLGLGPDDFINGNYSTDILAGLPPRGLTPRSEEENAAKNAIFLYAPGLMWKIDPPFPVTVTMTARGRSQAINVNPIGEGWLPISFISFSDIYPPAFRERYELKIDSLPGVPQPFSYTYTFTIRRIDSETVFAQVLPGDGPQNIRLGRDTPDFKLARLVPNVSCAACTIEVTDLTLTANIKQFVELPALPQPSNLRMSFPKRFSGLLVNYLARELQPVIYGNNTDDVTVSVIIPGDLTTVQPWCRKRSLAQQGTCPAVRGGQPVQTYFRFLNAVPQDAGESSLGGVSGVASASVSGRATVIVKREGHEIEKKKITLESGVANPLDQPTLPSWVLDDTRAALHSGAPEFSK